MPNSDELKNFINRNYASVFLAGIIFFTVFFSSSTLLTRPRIWVDESQTLELSRNFLKFGVLNAQISPGNFFEYPYLLQSTGYPLTVFLSALFSLFGYHFAVARIAMLAIMMAVLVAVYLIGGKLFGTTKALLAAGLLASFATFYGAGRTAVGDMPGFLFLLIFLYFWQTGKSGHIGGLFLGLAVVAKPSVFLLAIPALLGVLAAHGQGFLRRTAEIFSGAAIPALGWIVLVLGNPFVADIWVRILNFYRNPYGSAADFPVYRNMANFFESDTLVYFAILLGIIMIARNFLQENKNKSLYDFIILYSFLAFIYFLRSPGWLRYVQIGEFLVLFMLPDAVSVLVGKIRNFSGKEFFSGFAMLPVIFIILFQVFHLMTSADIYSSDSIIRAAEYINSNFSGLSVGVKNSLALSVLLKTDSRYQTFELAGIPVIGKGFILDGARPDVIVLNSGSAISEDEEVILSANYRPVQPVEGYDIYLSGSAELNGI